MKFSINIKTYALGVGLMLIPSTAKPMHSTAAQRIFSKVCTVLSWSIAAGPSFSQGAKMVHTMLNHKKHTDQYEDASPEVTQYVREVLKERGVPNYQTIAIKKNPTAWFPHGHASNGYAIFIPSNIECFGILNEKYVEKYVKDPPKDARFIFSPPKGARFTFLPIKNDGTPASFPYLNLRQLSELTTCHQNLEDNLRQKAWLEKKRFNKKLAQAALNLCNESLNVHRGVIHHEASHIVNKDPARFAILSFVTPFITHAGLTLCTHSLKQLLNNRHKVNILTKGILKISAAAFIKSPINLLIFCSYVRHREQRADDYIAGDLPLLRSIRDYWKFHDKYSTAISSFVEHGNTLSSLIERGNNDERKEQRQELLKKYPIIAHGLSAIENPVHPSPLQRAARTEKRIAKLEQQQQQDATTQRE